MCESCTDVRLKLLVVHKRGVIRGNRLSNNLDGISRPNKIHELVAARPFDFLITVVAHGDAPLPASVAAHPEVL